MEAIESWLASSPRKRRWLQCSLRTLLVVMVLASIGMSWFAVKTQQARRQEEATSAIMALPSCLVYYDRRGCVTTGPSSYYNCDPHGCPWNLEAGRPGTWIERLLGEHFCRRVVTAELSLNHCGQSIKHVKRLPHLRIVLVVAPDTQHGQELDSAVEAVRRELPTVEVWGVETDLSISDRE